MFNLKKYSQVATGDIVGNEDLLGPFSNIMGDTVQTTEREFAGQSNEQPAEKVTEGFKDEQEAQIQDAAQVAVFQEILNKIQQQYPKVLGKLKADTAFLELQHRAQQADARIRNPQQKVDGMSPDEVGAAATSLVRSLDSNTLAKSIMENARKINERIEDLLTQQNTRRLNIQPAMASQTTTTKTAQQPTSSFPVKNAADLAAKFFPRLLTNDSQTYAQAADEIISALQGEIQEEEINSMLESLRQLDLEQDQAKAMKIFGQMFDLLPSKLKTTMEMSRMTEQIPKGIFKFNLSEYILTDNTLIKTAADHFGQEYVLYGPTEKRQCPKLSGKNMGNVVSEYICRHHCLDGIVIDDNKTICGEALWRANVMDKFSRDYVDEDGKLIGGYLNRRFEQNRLVPEENKMRLKPGEVRKPRPPTIYGNLEARLQDMRKKNERDYRPEPNKGDVFNWTKDVDQNNVEATQTERDRREKAMGHELVQYTKKDEQENNPKIAFNLKQYKTAQQPSDLSHFQEIFTAIYDAKTPDELDAIWNSVRTIIKDPLNISRVYQAITEKIRDLFQQDAGNPGSENRIAKSRFAQAQQSKCPKCGGPLESQRVGFHIRQRCNTCGTESYSPGEFRSVLKPKPEPEESFEQFFNRASPKSAGMTGPRGPFGPDNPQSDDLGLSPDYDGSDDPELDRLYEKHLRHRGDAEEHIDNMYSYLSAFPNKAEMIRAISQQLQDPEVQDKLDIHDWDVIIDLLNENLVEKGEQEFARELLNIPNFPQPRPRRGPRYFAQNRVKQIKSAQGDNIPVPEDGANSDRFLEDPKRRQFKPMRGFESSTMTPEPPDQTPSEPAPAPTGSVVNTAPMPGDSRTKNQEEKKQLGSKLMELNPGGTQNPVYQVAAQWYAGEEVDDANLLQQAYDLVLEDNDPNHTESKSKVLNEMSRFLKVEEPKSMLAASKFNLRQYKQARKEKGTTYEGVHYDVNPWAVCTDRVGREDKDKYERCIHHVKEKSKDMEAPPKKKIL